MKFVKSLLMGTGAVVLAGSVLALLVPKAVHAIAATAVQVVNTSASPAVTGEVSLRASQIVTINCGLNNTNPPSVSCKQAMPDASQAPSSGPNGGYLVPNNAYFVIKSIDSELPNGAGLFAIRNGMSYTPSGMYIDPFESIVLPAEGQVSLSSGIVVAPGQELIPNPAFDGPGIVTFHGYLTAN